MEKLIIKLYAFDLFDDFSSQRKIEEFEVGKNCKVIAMQLNSEGFAVEFLVERKKDILVIPREEVIRWVIE